mmetsp:Transcript_85436/g.269300  ORF Transcript_85436/g.269300 Transcript_85436/m.269300 type:complete len:250 (+) Transcript_85436:134-883(+)
MAKPAVAGTAQVSALDLLHPVRGRVPVSVLLLEGLAFPVQVFGREVALIQVHHHVRLQQAVCLRGTHTGLRGRMEALIDEVHAFAGLGAHKVLEGGGERCDLMEVDATVAQALLENALEVLRHPLTVEVGRRGLVGGLQADDEPPVALQQQAVEGVLHSLVAEVTGPLLGQRGVHGPERLLKLMQPLLADVAGKLRDEVHLDVRCGDARTPTAEGQAPCRDLNFFGKPIEGKRGKHCEGCLHTGHEGKP